MIPLEKDPLCKEEAQEADISTKIILTSMNKKNREKNKETGYKRSYPISFQVLLMKWIHDESIMNWLIIKIVIHPYKGKMSWYKTTHASS